MVSRECKEGPKDRLEMVSREPREGQLEMSREPTCAKKVQG